MAKCEEGMAVSGRRCCGVVPFLPSSHGVLAAAWESEETLQCGVSPYSNPCARHKTRMLQ